MSFEFRSFRTKVARRVFLLFILCAIVPVSALAVISYIHVRNQLLDQSKFKLSQQGKVMAVSVYERLLFLRTEMRTAAFHIASSLKRGEAVQSDFGEGLKEKFFAAALVSERGDFTPLFGSVPDLHDLTSSEKRHILSGKALLRIRKDQNSSIRIRIFGILDQERPSLGLLMVEINPQYLWGAAEGLPAGSAACILDNDNAPLYASTMPEVFPFPAESFRGATFAHAGHMEWELKGNTYFGAYWTLFLEPNFFHPLWTIVISESAKDVLAPMANFQKAFLAILVIAAGMVFFLSFNLIRKSLVPMEILKEGTRKIAAGDFAHKVEIKSGDEFESLADSFNEMSSKVQESQGLLVKAAKLGTMGQMSAGIMHEIKQPLTAIHGLLQLSLMDGPPPDSRKRLETAMTAVERLNSILSRFKTFARMSDEVMLPLSVNSVLDQVTKLLEHQLMMSRVRLSMSQEKDLPGIFGDGQGLQQVFSNLLINAADAFDTKEGERVVQVKTFSKDGKVFVEIEDNGCGIPEEIQKKIFDPFFTTKSAEKGTGLGMAIVETILHKHNASIDLRSAVGVGTKFTITIPIHVPAQAPAAGTPNERDPGKERT